MSDKAADALNDERFFDRIEQQVWSELSAPPLSGRTLRVAADACRQRATEYKRQEEAYVQKGGWRSASEAGALRREAEGCATAIGELGELAQEPLPITAEQVNAANRLIEVHCPPAESTTAIQVALGHLALWLQTGGKYPRIVPLGEPPHVWPRSLVGADAGTVTENWLPNLYRGLGARRFGCAALPRRGRGSLYRRHPRAGATGGRKGVR